MRCRGGRSWGGRGGGRAAPRPPKQGRVRAPRRWFGGRSILGRRQARSCGRVPPLSPGTGAALACVRLMGARRPQCGLWAGRAARTDRARGGTEAPPAPPARWSVCWCVGGALYGLSSSLRPLPLHEPHLSDTARSVRAGIGGTARAGRRPKEGDGFLFACVTPALRVWLPPRSLAPLPPSLAHGSRGAPSVCPTVRAEGHRGGGTGGANAFAKPRADGQALGVGLGFPRVCFPRAACRLGLPDGPLHARGSSCSCFLLCAKGRLGATAGTRGGGDADWPANAEAVARGRALSTSDLRPPPPPSPSLPPPPHTRSTSSSSSASGAPPPRATPRTLRRQASK